MKKTFFTYSTLCLTLFLVSAQTEEDRAYIVERTNVEVLENFVAERTAFYEEMMQKALEEGVPLKIVNDKNEIGYLAGFDQDGTPQYDFETNVEAAITSGVNDLWNGGANNLSLNGLGIQIGHWEAGGLALTTHVEFGGRVVHAENQVVSSHATHTACTMIGAGLDPEARGMANAANIVSRRSPNDEAEVASFAAAGGLVSNHSYTSGNPNGDIPRYGLYNGNAQEWDEILYNAPFLSVCKSAGNDRNDAVNVGDNGYDLLYGFSCSKNVFTVGAVDAIPFYNGPSSVQQSAFTSWGPTDDWRIKPDVTANGVSLYSADNTGDFDYTFKSGTSMSAPIVTGTITLLQELYRKLKGNFMTSAMVKALLVSTTDEAGTFDGPDFQSGWGLLNARTAAEVVSTNDTIDVMRQLSLNIASMYTTKVQVDGTAPLTVAIAWTDPPGNALTAGLDDFTPKLVNDLDLRITKDGVVYEPWVLTPNVSANNFEDPAFKGDNFRDNVERIDVLGIPAGEYTVSVTHKGILVDGKQDFAMILRGILKVEEEPISIREIGEGLNPIQVYPIPSQEGRLNVTIPDAYQAEKYEVKIYNLQGRLVLTEDFQESNIRIDVSDLNPGLFMLNVQIEGKRYNQLVVLE